MARTGRTLSLTCFKADSGSSQPFAQQVGWVLSPRIKWSLIAVNGLPPSNAEGYERVELYFHSRTRHSWHSESLSTLYKRKHLYSQ